MEIIFEFIFELIFEGIIEGSTNKKVSKPIRIICTILMIMFFTLIIGGLGYLAVSLFLTKEYLGSVSMFLITIVLLGGTIYKFIKIGSKSK